MSEEYHEVNPDSPMGQKLLAEALKLRVEAEVAQFARIAKEAEASKFLAEARKFVADAEVAEITLAAKRREERDLLASNKHNHVYEFNKSVDDSSVDSCLTTLTAWSRVDPMCDITVIFYSPGGNVLAGMKLFDFFQELRNKGHFLRTKCLGMAASMAGILLQAGTERVMGKESYVLIHEIATGMIGKISEIEDEVTFVHMIQDRVLDIFASRATPINKKSTVSFFKSHWNRKDWWIDSEECLKLGIVDRVE